MKRTVFISYSWDSEEHCSWVGELADRLKSNGITVWIDRDLKPGYHILRFVENAITSSDFVLIICTPKYKAKADSGRGGVGYEGGIISNEIYCNHNESKFIPILREGSFSTAVPNFCAGKKGIVMSGDAFSSREYRVLLQTITDDNTSAGLDEYRNKIDDAKEKICTNERLTSSEQETVLSYLDEIIEETYKSSTNGQALKKAVERMIQGINDEPGPNNFSCTHEMMHCLFTEIDHID